MTTFRYTVPVLGVLLMQGMTLANRQVYNNVSAATMVILAGDSQGSGVLVDAQRRLAVTAWHVVETVDVAAEERVDIVLPFFDAFDEIITDTSFYAVYEAQLASSGYITTARVVAFDPHKDLAVLELESVPNAIQGVRLASESVTAGDILHIVGHPSERPPWAYSVGITDYVEDMPELDWWSEFDAKTVWFFGTVWYGNSGGPVVNDRGELVGIVTAKTDIEHLAIHVDEVTSLMATLDVEAIELAQD